MARSVCRLLGLGVLTAAPVALLALLMAEPPEQGSRKVDPAPLRPGGKLAVLNFTASLDRTWPITKSVYLRRQPGEAIPTEDVYGLAVFRIPGPDPGEVIVRTKYISIDPGPMRGRLGHGDWELSSINANDPADIFKVIPHFIGAECVGILEASTVKELPVGRIVRGNWGMADRARVSAHTLQLLSEHHRPMSLALGVLGVTGRTAFHGVEILKPRAGETLLVTGAAGATGSVAGQLGKIAGCRVIGSAGTAAKVKYLVDVLGFDAAFNYREEDPAEALARLAPSGIDLFFENTGGPVSEAAFPLLNDGARVAVSGLINTYHTSWQRPIRQLRMLLPSSLRAGLSALASPGRIPEAFRARLVSSRMQAWHTQIGRCDRAQHTASVRKGKASFTVEHFLVTCFDLANARQGLKRAEETLAGYIRDGRLRGDETILRGSIEDAPRAAINVWSGGNTGKQLIELV